MKNNLVLWEYHYREVLIQYYNDFCNLFSHHGEEEPNYKEFVNFCYQNTKKSIISKPGVMSKQVHSLII